MAKFMKATGYKLQAASDGGFVGWGERCLANPNKAAAKPVARMERSVIRGAIPGLRALSLADRTRVCFFRQDAFYFGAFARRAPSGLHSLREME
jgi:hypothetical protein